MIKILLFLFSIIFLSHTHAEDVEDCSVYVSNEPQHGNTVKALSQEAISCFMRKKERLDKFKHQENKKIAGEAAVRIRENSPSHSEYSYQRCIIKNISTANNDFAARSTQSECNKYPLYALDPESDFWGYDTAAECFKDLGTKTPSMVASRLIANACQDLYPGRVGEY